jgi:hypothetical protein
VPASPALSTKAARNVNSGAPFDASACAFRML